LIIEAWRSVRGAYRPVQPIERPLVELSGRTGGDDVDKDDRELVELKRRIAALTDEARKNVDAWQRSQRREMALLEADSLGTLFERVTTDLRTSYRLAAVTLVLGDPEREVRHLLATQGQHGVAHKDVLFVDSVPAIAPQLAARHTPWLGRFARPDHTPLFPSDDRLQSVALLPLRREAHLIGSLNLGSEDRGRFTRHLATDFLHHLAVIAAFCLENGVNRARLVRSGLTDSLTGWHNRRYLQTRLREEIARSQRDHSALTCLMIDVDHFKKINDQHGHLVGDEILRQVAQRIGTEVRDSDVSARYGGEEFVVLLPRTSIDAGLLLAERMRRSVLAKSFELPDVGEAIAVTVSIGVAEHRGDPGTNDLPRAAEQLVARADDALYQAKAKGRNAVVHADDR
jgi:two-component system, cell cycle response regulator